MPRYLIPSPNEEAEILERARLQQKKERILAARKQSLEWCKLRTSDHIRKNKQKQISDNLKETKSKLVELEDKENVLQSQLNKALQFVGEAYSSAQTENNLEKDIQKAQLAAECQRIAEERHKSALKKLNEVKAQQSAEQGRTKQLKEKAKELENLRTKRLLENPLKNTQPLIEIPKPKSHRSLGGLDAFTKTYFHLPTDVGVVDENSLETSTTKTDARTLAIEVEGYMKECRAKLEESKQAREERADVRGTDALKKVQLKNVLEDVTSQLDKYAIFARNQKKPSTIHTNIFASNLAVEATKKQHQMDLEHAVEDVFDKHQQDLVEMVLPSAIRFEEVRKENEEELSVIEEEQVEEEDLVQPVEEDSVEEAEVVDDLADESRPSLSLYFPIQSDLSSEQSPEKTDDDITNNDDVTSDTSYDLGPVSPPIDPIETSTVPTEDSTLQYDPSDTTITEFKPTSSKKTKPINLSGLIADQLKINQELRALAKPLNTDTETNTPLSQPPAISFTKSPPSSSAAPSSSTLESILQELLSTPSSSVIRSSDNSHVSSNSVISQHTLSQNSSPVQSTPKSQDVSCGSVGRGSVAGSSSSMSSGLSMLQRQLSRINNQLSEIERIKQHDAMTYEK